MGEDPSPGGAVAIPAGVAETQSVHDCDRPDVALPPAKTVHTCRVRRVPHTDSSVSPDPERIAGSPVYRLPVVPPPGGHEHHYPDPRSSAETTTRTTTSTRKLP